MKTISILLLTFIMLACSSCFKKMAQSQAADRNDELHFLEKHYSEDQMNKLLSTKTVFFYRKGDKPALDSLKQSLNANWTITPLIFADISEFDTYYGNPDFSYFIIEGITTTTYSSSGSYSNTHYYLTLQSWDRYDSKKKKVQTDAFCRIELYPNSSTLFSGTYVSKKNDVIGKLYDHGEFYNWTPVLLGAHLGIVDANLRNKYRPWLYADVSDPNIERLARKDTLFILNTDFKSFNKFNGKETKNSDLEFSAYGGPYRVCNSAELFQIFENEKRGRLLFEYVKSSTDKYVSVIDTRDKKYIYKKYTPVSYNLKSKDLAKILNN
jgi:hypothetical protein